MDSILEEAAKVAEEILLPTNAPGDEVGCVLENGVVRTPKGYKEAYNAFRDGGWTALASDPKYGGQGLPESLNKLVEEMICSANLAFSLYPGLTHGAYQALASHASDELKDLYLPKMVDGTWSGTMCLTEANAGTDLGLLRTRAVPQDDGSYRISGSKIFISAGDHDLTENIIHLVLARLPDAPPGTRGISMFLVPKFIPAADGRPGARNGVVCTAIEHKMGIKGSATCQLQFEDATGWLVGDANRGLADHVHHDEQRAPVRRHPGPRRGRNQLPERRRLCPRPHPGAQPERRQGRRQGRGPDHRASRRAAHAADDPLVYRRLPRARRLGGAATG